MQSNLFIKSLLLPYDNQDEDIKNKRVMSDSLGDTAQINAGSLSVFSETLSSLNKSDIMHSTLLAQLSANALYSRFEQVVDWNNYFFHVLENLGWNIPKWAFQPILEPVPINWEDIVIDLMKSIATPYGIDLTKKGINAAKKLEPEHKGFLLWKDNTSECTKGNFLIHTSSIVKDTTVTALTSVNFNSSIYQDTFLNWRIKYDIYGFGAICELNENIYKLVREQVIDKLGDRVKSKVVDIPM